jgi:PAS domain S-box-containing protein
MVGFTPDSVVGILRIDWSAWSGIRKRNTVLGIIIWTLIIALSFIWNIYSAKEGTKELAKNEARVNFNKDYAFRLWVAKHGGVYVPATKDTPPNPNLSHVPERDIKTPSGRQLTLMNPAYMFRQLTNEFLELYGVKGRMTSLKPLYPPNAPDEWEKNALTAFEKGVKEVFEFTDMDGEPYLRLMRPTIAKKPCLKCHAFQGYKEGDIRGGVGVSIPMTPYLAIQQKTINTLITAHFFIWIFGLIVIGFISVKARALASERIKAEDRLRRSEDNLNRAQEVARIGSWSLDIPKNELMWSKETYRIFGVAFDTPLTYEAFLQMVHPDDRNYVDRSWKAALSGEPYDIEHRIVVNGDIKWVHEKAEPAFNEKGEPLSAIGTVQDITEHKMATERLKDTVHTLEMTKTAALNIMEDLQQEIKEHKRTEEALREKSLQRDELNRMLEHKVAEEVKKNIEKDSIMMHQSRLAAMGAMISAIAHQWRQPLNALGLIIQDIKDADEYGELTKDYIDRSVKKSMNQIKFMSKTIDDFRNFFRPDKERQAFDIKLAAGDILSMLSAQLKSNNISYRLTCHEHNKTVEDFREIIPCDAFNIAGYPNEMKQVFMNIVNNAKDAILQRREEGLMPAGKKGLILFDFEKEGDKKVIRITDNGGGIPQDIIDRIFDPYFTTKEQGRGTGIGLYMSKVIVESNMGGRLSVRNFDGGA